MTRIDIFKLNVGIIIPFKVALGMIGHCEKILIRIHSSDGINGLDEGAAMSFITGETQATSFEAAKDMVRLMIGKNRLAIEEPLRDLGRMARTVWFAWATARPTSSP